jgi:hypothetical protein
MNSRPASLSRLTGLLPGLVSRLICWTRLCQGVEGRRQGEEACGP